LADDTKPKKVIVEGNAVGKPAGPYSHAVIAGGFAFVSGQGPRDPSTGELASGGIGGQTDQTMKNVLAILKAIGLDFSDVVKVSAFLSDMSDFKGFNEAYGKYFQGELPPARTTVQAVLPRAGMLVEVEVTAKTRS
jgi:2-iminobutanoate/2-iminopropanoate deaminase